MYGKAFHPCQSTSIGIALYPQVFQPASKMEHLCSILVTSHFSNLPSNIGSWELACKLPLLVIDFFGYLLFHFPILFAYANRELSCLDDWNLCLGVACVQFWNTSNTCKCSILEAGWNTWGYKAMPIEVNWHGWNALPYSIFSFS